MKMRNRSNMQFPTLPSELHLLSSRYSGNKFCRRFPTSPSAIMTMRGFFQNLGGDCHMYTLAKEKERKGRKQAFTLHLVFYIFCLFSPCPKLL